MRNIFYWLAACLCVSVALASPASAQERSAVKQGFTLAPNSAKKILVFRPAVSVGAQSTGEPIRFLGNEGVSFTYQFTDEDQLTRQGEARAAIIGGKLYMITFEAPRLNYFGRYIIDFRALADSAKLP